MFSVNTTLNLLLVLAILVAPISGLALTFQNQADTSLFYTSFSLTYLSAGTSVSIVVNPLSYGVSYNILLWRPLQKAPDQQPFQNAGPFTGPKSFVCNPIDASGNWRVQILPAGSDFIFETIFYVNGSIIGDYYGIASYGRVFQVYYGVASSYNATLSISAGSLSDITFALYGPFANPTVTGGSPINPITSGSWSSTINYSAAANSYYYFVVKPNQNQYKLNGLIRLTYQSDIYACPYLNAAKDYNSNFLGCSNNAPTKGNPCLQNDPVSGYCTSCVSPYVANQYGVCIYSFNCPSNQYFHYGACYNVIDNCAIFQVVGTGTCSVCNPGYNLVNYSNGSQLCDQIAQNCTQNQYLVGKVCFNLVPNCSDFVQLTGICKSCSYGFNLANNTCVAITNPLIVCPVGMAVIGTVCQIIDPYCIFYGSSPNCQLCAAGWLLDANYKCYKIQCGSRQYSSKGYCDSVSVFCDAYDPIYGNCTTCLYGYNLQLNGTCIQPAPGSTVGGAANTQTCPNGYYLSGGTCTQVSSLCYGYDQQTGLCTSCQDPVGYQLVNGVCMNRATTCQNTPRTYFNHGVCSPVDSNCDQFEITNGTCYLCYSNTYLDPVSTVCMFNQTCNPATQYKARDGTCVTGNVNCTSFDQSTGACLSCQAGFDLNNQTCCRHDSYIDTSECKVFLQQNCASFSNVTGCATCATNYVKPIDNNGYPLYYSKCILKT